MGSVTIMMEDFTFILSCTMYTFDGMFGYVSG